MSTTPFQSLHRTCVLIQTPYTYRLCLKIPTQSLGSKNNLGRLLCKELQIRIGLSPVYENLVIVYKDLWLPDEQRADMSEYGIATENLRKLMSGDDSTSTSDKADNALFKARGKRVKIKLRKILNNQGLFAPGALNGSIEFNFKTPNASEIMIAQSGESVGDYVLKEPKLIYESIESSDAYSQAAAEYADTVFSFDNDNSISFIWLDEINVVVLLQSFNYLELVIGKD